MHLLVVMITFCTGHEHLVLEMNTFSAGDECIENERSIFSQTQTQPATSDFQTYM